LQVALRSEPWRVEPSLVELPWRPAASIPSKLKIGVIYHDGYLTPHPPVSRCVKTAVEAILQAGHEVVRWNPSLHLEIVECINKLLSLDNGQGFMDELKAGGEPLTPLSQMFLDRVSRNITYTVRDSWKLNMQRDDLRLAYAKAWNEAGIDAILCPVSASVASAHGEAPYWGYTSVFNLLDYSTVVFPVGAVETTDTWENIPPESKGPMSDEDVLSRVYYTGSEKYANAPVGLQIVTRRFKDEEGILIGKEITRALGR